MVPSGHLAASITHSQTAQEILKRVFLGSNLLLQSHKLFIPGDKRWYKFGFILNCTRLGVQLGVGDPQFLNRH
ncbi:hypothetical protein DKX38_023066 [Salix brachista]|uniref:Uncharacterized protein n=1 Tax=Salix brachista TaxID=2182728 RepID=A0A5N5KC60_9ROSI|nr:hypothetical protein DKX38_023066 [Salix brachista]